MTIEAEPVQIVDSHKWSRLFEFHLTKTTRASAKVAGMQSRTEHELRIAATERDSEVALATELGILRDVFRLLPTGVTLQDEQGRFLLVNDAAAAQLRMAGSKMEAPASRELDHRRQTGMELLRTGRHAVAEECLEGDQAKQVFLTTHRPVRIADRNLLLSSSADISEQKALEDCLLYTSRCV